MPKTPCGDPVLETWPILNDYLQGLTSEAECVRLLGIEMMNRRRKMFIYRIFHRRSRIRYEREWRMLREALAHAEEAAGPTGSRTEAGDADESGEGSASSQDGVQALLPLFDRRA